MKKTKNWYDLIIYQKTSKSFLLCIKKNGQVQDITGYTIYFTVKEKLSDGDTGAIISQDITSHIDALNGKTVIELSKDDTDLEPGSYFYDIISKDTEDKVSLIAMGRITINKHPTTRQ
jgi:hypothetical protein